MKNLAHSASLHSKEKIGPSKSGIKHLGLRLIRFGHSPCTPRQRLPLQRRSGCRVNSNERGHALAKEFSPSRCGRIFPLFFRVMRVGLLTGRCINRPESGLSGPIFCVSGATGSSGWRFDTFGKAQGIRSSVWALGYPLLMAWRVLRIWAYGVMLLSLPVSIRDALRAQVWPPASPAVSGKWPATRAVLRVRGMGRMVFSAGLVSLSTRPSVRKICSPSQ